MRSVITLLALFAFSLHLLLGCCAHHAHGKDGLPGHNHDHAAHHLHLPAWLCPGGTEAHHHGHDHSDGGHHHEHDDDSLPTPHLPCADPDCVFVAAGAGSTLNPIGQATVSLPVMVADLLGSPNQLASSITRVGESDISPHLRRHLALSRFLN